ncbi:MAG: hypothetical protein ABS81_29440 [Pseudonocardia sp. SCN 72-86]|nr:MAG: hypothetical protein ABS81_29440 [Pseudonocardia sp. SCN 72-86]
MPLPPFLQSIIDWVRAGYPEGLPQQDYLPLVALLGNQLTNDDVAAVAEHFAETGDAATASSIRDAIGKVSHAVPTDEDIARVRARLAAGGWPLAPLHSVQPAGPDDD